MTFARRCSKLLLCHRHGGCFPAEHQLLAADPFSFNAGTQVENTHISALEGARSGLLRRRQRGHGEGGPVRKMEGWAR